MDKMPKSKIISKDAESKSILIEVIDSNIIFSSWVFDELTNPKECIINV